mgnify:CR=1 FL=1
MSKVKEVFTDEVEKNQRLSELRMKGIAVREFHYGGKLGKPKPNRWELFYER